MTMLSVPSTTSRFRGEASSSMGKHLAGRRLAKRSSSLRRPRSPRSGFCSCGRASHLGPPTAPKRMASLCSHSRRVEAGSGSPVASMAAPPMRAASNSKEAPVARPTTSSTLRASGVTSCPMPSPPSSAILCVGTTGPLPGRRAWSRCEAATAALPEAFSHSALASWLRPSARNATCAEGSPDGADGAQLIVLEPTLEPGDGVNGVQHRVHRPVAHARVLEDLGVLLETHRGRGDDARPADHVQVVERVRLGHLGDLVLDDGDQVVVEDLLLLVREILEPLEGLAELALVEIEPELSQPRGESGPARVLAHDELVGGPADVFRLHDLVGELFLEHTVLVDARLVGEGVLAHDGLVGLHVHARN